MKHLVLVAIVLSACAPAVSAPVEAAAPTGPRTIRKGEQLDAVLRLGESHQYRIELAASEAVHWTVEGEGECGNWSYAWMNPDGGWVTGNPLPLAPNEDGSGLRTAEADVAAEVAGGGEMVGVAGVWELKIEADPANCPRIAYRVRAD